MKGNMCVPLIAQTYACWWAKLSHQAGRALACKRLHVSGESY